ncbi:helix-turn-helix domain-containing protein [Actinomadura barringtoniae]|uniref:Helix-turn-helix domain-containing protein n=1 Tax=Actinomadura barringtoniae TaxID=1427535 RepID=A0A939PSZ5_9ACTN|nr:PucR family transcriptional regulator [Actinomadura barringtoniae]MBO2455733.1 helix-turn-helix domain-containing protein [Actinomadura barringtoniae]
MGQPRLDTRPFEAIPRELAARLRPYTRQDGAPEGGQDFLDGFCSLIEDPQSAREHVASRCVDLGRQLAREGRDLADVHGRLRRSGRAVWRTLNGAVDALDLDRAVLGHIAEAHFGYLDAVSELVARGHDAETSGTADAQHRRRTRLLALLLADPGTGPNAGVDADAVGEAARSAGWDPPRTAAVVNLHPRDVTDREFPPMPPDVLVDVDGAEPCLLLPDPDGPGRLRLLEPLLPRWIVAVGPTVPLSRAAESARWAREAALLARRGTLPHHEVIRTIDHVPTLVVFQAQDLIEQLAAERLAPLNELTPVQAERLSETLLALLENRFNATEVGELLHIHPQTVRYRLRHLEELFGDELRDPRRCLEIEMILHARAQERPQGKESYSE